MPVDQLLMKIQVTTSESLRNLKEGVDEEDHETVEKVGGRHQMAEELLQVTTLDNLRKLKEGADEEHHETM